jgi:hypothetical protein
MYDLYNLIHTGIFCILSIPYIWLLYHVYQLVTYNTNTARWSSRAVERRARINNDEGKFDRFEYHTFVYYTYSYNYKKKHYTKETLIEPKDKSTIECEIRHSRLFPKIIFNPGVFKMHFVLCIISAVLFFAYLFLRLSMST